MTRIRSVGSYNAFTYGPAFLGAVKLRRGRPPWAGLESLSASERRVADLAATGQSNREIAQALYVTPKTVEVHLANAYRKLGIRSIQGLPQAPAA